MREGLPIIWLVDKLLYLALFEYTVSREIVQEIIVKDVVEIKRPDGELMLKTGKKLVGTMVLKGKPEPVIEQIMKFTHQMILGKS